MIASTWFDVVIGVDLHWEMFPAPPAPPPAGVPTPLPNPFLGMTFDPVGAAVGMAISNAIGAVMGASFKGPVLVWTAFLPTNTGTEAKNYLGVPHILIPPGFAWAPVPRTPKPVIRPGETPTPPKPVTPDGDAVVITGSKTVTVMGSNWARLGDIALSCSEPVRLPSSTIIPIPKGAPVLVGGPPTLDLLAALLASLRTRFMGDSLQALISRMRPGRLRSAFSRVACFLTGHPVDVASGRVLTDFTDFELPGPLPLTFRRSYISGFAARPSPVGHGWQHTLNQCVWEEPGRVVYLGDDGREIEFDTFEFPEHRMRPGDEVYEPLNRLTLRCDGGGRYRIWDIGRMELGFEPVSGADPCRAYLTRIGSADGAHEITLTYDRDGRLDWCRDSAGRLIRFTHDARGRLTAVDLPLARGSGWSTHRSYSYDEHDDLVAVTDSLGHRWGFEYFSHLLVRETDRTGLSFYFAYDGSGEDAWCTRTWGDGGLFDHVLRYDKRGRKTFVTNSRGHTTVYAMNLIGQVVEVTQPMGGVTKYEYDPRSGQRSKITDPMGATTETLYDERGNAIALINPAGGRTEVEFDAMDRPIVGRNAVGGVYTWAYDERGHLIERCYPEGGRVRMGWEAGVLTWAEDGGGRRTRRVYGDRQVEHALEIDPNGGRTEIVRDGRGRVVRRRDPRGSFVDIRYDTEDRVVAIEVEGAIGQTFTYNAEGDLVEARTPTRHVRNEYGGYHRVVKRYDGERSLELRYDTEGELVAIINEQGEEFRCELDADGQVIRETDFDGSTRSYVRDAGGRVTRMVAPSGRSTDYRHHPCGKILEAVHSDGTFVRNEYRADGKLVRTENETTAVDYELDSLGRVVREIIDGVEVRSQYGADGHRTLMASSLGARQAAAYDARGDLLELSLGLQPEGADARIAFQRDAMGSELARRFWNGVQCLWQRDGLGRPLRQTTALQQGGQLRTVDDQGFHWRGIDQIQAIVNPWRGDRRFDHDPSGRLVSERWGEQVRERGFDRAGNVFAQRDGGDRRYSPGGRLTSANGVHYEHDGDGNRVVKIEADGGRWEYEWNGHGLLIEVLRPDKKRVRFEYDPLKRRTRKSVFGPGSDAPERSVRFVWDGHQMIHEIDSHGGKTTWYWEPRSTSLVARERDGEPLPITNDHIGGAMGLFDAGGRPQWWRTPALARDQISLGAERCPWRGPGQYHDEETGELYNWHRYVDPSTGIFLSKDLLAPWSTQNPYGLPVDPLTQSDPYGLFFGSTRQVGYWTNDFQQPLNDIYNGQTPHNPGAPPGRPGANVAVAELADGRMLPFASGNGLHSEQAMITWMKEQGIPPSQVRRIYSELNPCLDRCLPALRDFLGDHAKNVQLEFTWVHTDRSVARERLEAQRARCGG